MESSEQLHSESSKTVAKPSFRANSGVPRARSVNAAVHLASMAFLAPALPDQHITQTDLKFQCV